MPDLTDVKAGNTIWVTVINRPEVTGRIETVSKVGRKWLTTGYGPRFDRRTGMIEPSACGAAVQAWRSEQEFDRHNLAEDSSPKSVVPDEDLPLSEEIPW